MFACFAQLTCVLSLTSSSPRIALERSRFSTMQSHMTSTMLSSARPSSVRHKNRTRPHLTPFTLSSMSNFVLQKSCYNSATVTGLSQPIESNYKFFKGHSRVLLNPSIGPIFCSLISANSIQENQQGCSPITNQCSWLMCYVQTSQFSALCTNFHCKKYLKQFPSIFFLLFR